MPYTPTPDELGTIDERIEYLAREAAPHGGPLRNSDTAAWTERARDAATDLADAIALRARGVQPTEQVRRAHLILGDMLEDMALEDEQRTRSTR